MVYTFIITLNTYNSYFLQYNIKKILLFINKNNNSNSDKIFIKKLICLPKQKKKLTIIRSPFGHKVAREQFEIRTYKACFYIVTTYSLFYYKLLKFNNVFIKCKRVISN